ncbi:MAG: hypothetical protein V3R58_01190 [candidate division NC10 bacterium]
MHSWLALRLRLLGRPVGASGLVLLLFPRCEFTTDGLSEVVVVHPRVEPNTGFGSVPSLPTNTGIRMLYEPTTTLMFFIEELLEQLISLEILPVPSRPTAASRRSRGRSRGTRGWTRSRLN